MYTRTLIAALTATALFTAAPLQAAPDTGKSGAATCMGHLDRPVTPAFYARCLAPRPTGPAAAARPAAAGTAAPEPIDRQPAAMNPDPGSVHFLSFAPVQFQTGKADLSPAARQTLDYVAGAVQGWPGMRHLVIVGHADVRGTAAYNDGLSARRAAAVAQYLQQRGVVPEAISQRATGAREPADQSWTATGRTRNRRVELYAVLR